MSENKTPIPGKPSSPTNKPEKAQSAKNKPQQKQIKKSPWILWAVIALVFVLAVGFFQYRVETLIKQNSALESHIQLLDRDFKAQTKDQLTKSAEQGLQLKQLASMDKQLGSMQQTINQIPGAKMDDWKLAEVEYLLRLGNQRVNLQQELSAAWALFDASNQILASLDDPGLLIVREKIAEEMLLLGQDKKIDRQGIYTQIQALKASIHQDIQPPTSFTNQALNNVDTQSNAVNEGSISLMAQLKSLVSLKKSDTPFDAPLNTQQYQLLEHSLRLMLEQAQWALLKADQTLYEASLTNANQWIDSKLRHHKAASLSESIKQLRAQNIQINIPDVSQSLRLLRQLLSDRTHRPSDINTEKNEAVTQPITPTMKPIVKKTAEQA